MWLSIRAAAHHLLTTSFDHEHYLSINDHHVSVPCLSKPKYAIVTLLKMSIQVFFKQSVLSYLSALKTGQSLTVWRPIPEEAVEVSVPHVLKHHGQGLSVRAHAVETHNVLVLEHRQQLRLPLEVLPGRLVGVFERLRA